MREFVFDPDKDHMNREKHGVSLELADHLVWDEAFIHADERKDYGEQWMIAIAPMGRRLYVVVYTDQGHQRRIISLRKANEREVRAYIAKVGYRTGH